MGGGTDYHDRVSALGVYNTDSTNVLVASGGFQDIGGIPANYIAQGWQHLGTDGLRR